MKTNQKSEAMPETHNQYLPDSEKETKISSAKLVKRSGRVFRWLTPLRCEAPGIFPLFGPILISQYANIANGVIDTAMAARLGTVELGGVAVGVALWMPIYMFVIGVLVSVLVSISQHAGADDHASVRRTAHQGLWLGGLLGVLAAIVIYLLSFRIEWFGATGDLVAPAQEYLRVVILGLPIGGMAVALRFYCEGQGKVMPVTVMVVFMVCWNAFFKYGLMFGNLGMPALGLKGCGLATVLGMAAFFLMIIGYVTLNPVQAAKRLFLGFGLPDRKEIKRLVLIGVPIGLSITSEYLVYSTITFFISTVGAVAVAAHQVAYTCMLFFFSTPGALCLASSIRIGTLNGQKNQEILRRSVLGIITLSGLIGVAYTLLMFFGSARLASVLSTDPAVIVVAVGLIQIAAMFQLSDAIQVCFIGILRGVDDTATPFAITAAMYWLFCLPLGYVLSGMPLPFGLTVPSDVLGIQGWWVALTISLTAVSVILGIRVYHTFWGCRETS